MKPDNRRGLYEIFTTFIFIVIAVGVVFMALLIAGKITLVKSQSSETRIRQSFANEAFDTITACNKQEVIEEKNVGPCLDKLRGVKGVQVHQPAFGGCEEKTWGSTQYQAALLDTNTGVFPYWISIMQAKGGLVCLAQLNIVI